MFRGKNTAILLVQNSEKHYKTRFSCTNSFCYFPIGRSANLHGNFRLPALVLTSARYHSRMHYKHYQPTLNLEKNIPFERSMFCGVKQQPSETIEQYITRLHQLSLHCRDQVIPSCTSTKLHIRLLIVTNLTLEMTTNIAKVMKNADHFTITIEENNLTATTSTEKNFKISSRQSTPSNQKSQVPNICTCCGIKGHTRKECRPSRNQTCNKCGKQGHFLQPCASVELTIIRHQHPPKNHQHPTITTSIIDVIAIVRHNTMSTKLKPVNLNSFLTMKYTFSKQMNKIPLIQSKSTTHQLM